MQKELKIEFNEKCKTFLKAMYSSSLKIQINEELLLNESIQWLKVIKEKIKHTINFSAFRKALESDDISFAIIQWTYKSILKIFNLMYSDLIIIIINSYIFMTLIKSIHEKLYAIYIEWTKLSEIENHSLFIWLLYAVETIIMRLCIKLVHINCMLEYE